MSIATFDELVESVLEWSHRNDLLTKIPTFISLAENAMYNNNVEPLKVRSMEVTSTTLTISRYLDLPDNFESSRSTRLIIEGGGDLKYVTPEALKRVETVGVPYYFTIVGNEIEFNCTPDDQYSLQLQYFRKADPLTKVNQTNEILTNHPLVYLNGALMELFTYSQDVDQLSIYQQRFYESVKGANKADKRGRYGNAPSVIIDNNGLRP